MGRQKVGNGAVIVKKDEKVEATIAALKNMESFDEVYETFQKLYPKEWTRLNLRYEEHQRLTKPGKGHPMPKPEQYMKNTFTHGLKKFKSKQTSS